MTSRRAVLMPIMGALALLLLAFITTGGVLGSGPTQAPNTWVNVVLILAGAVALGALIVTRRGEGGALSLGLFAAVAALSALSIAWSVAPDQSWEESGRTVAYVAAFGGALAAARLFGGGTRRVVLAVTLAAVGLSSWALIVKALDLDLYGQRCYGPLLAPFSYWNATGVTGAIALPGCVYFAADRTVSRLGRGLAVAGIAVAASVVVLTYSRSAVAAAAIATLLPLCFLANRRRAALNLALGLLGGLPVWIFGLTSQNVSGDESCSLFVPSAVPIHRAGSDLVLGLIMLVMVLVLIVAGTLTAGYLDTAQHPARRLATIDRGLLGLLLLVPVAVVVWLLVNRRGPGGEISHLWTALTNPSAQGTGGGSAHLGSLSNSRSAYWREALAVGEHHVLAGSGVGTFNPAYLRYQDALLNPPGADVQNAHSYVLETFATLGLLGVLLNLGLFCAWCTDAIRAVGHRLRTTAPSEADARWALIGAVIAFGVSSALDWTWFFPGVAVPALLAAGWIAGSAGSRRRTAASPGTAGLTRPAVPPPNPARARPLGARPGAILALTLVLLVSLAVAWESVQPLRADESITASSAAQDAGNGPAALSDARSAVSEDPLSAAALERLGAVYGALGDAPAERAKLIQATHVQPDNPQPFAAYGGYLLCGGHFSAAAPYLVAAVNLDLTDSFSQNAMLAAARDGSRPNAAFCDGQL